MPDAEVLLAMMERSLDLKYGGHHQDPWPGRSSTRSRLGCGTPDVMVNIIKQFVFLHHKRFLSLHYAHVWLNLVVFPEVSLSLDCLIEEGEDDDQQKSVENTENGKTTGLWVRARTCSNKYLHLQNIGERRSTLAL